MKLSGARLACLLLVVAAPLQAFDFDEPAPDRDQIPVVLTPARLSQPQSQVPASVTVIDRELIKATGAREIYQLLQLVPGMSAVKVDGNVPTVSYHGTQSRDVRRMLVMIDGRSQYLPGLARVLWNDFPIEIEDIERIEVTRGPASAAYGANAFQGVINIVTRHPADVVGEAVAARAGNNGVQDWRVTSSGGSDGLSSRFTVASRDDDGYTEPFRGEPRRDRKSVQTVNLRTHVELNDRDGLEFMLGGSRRQLEIPTVRSDFDDITDFTTLPENLSDEAFAQVRWQRQVSDSHQLKVQAYTQYKSTRDDFSGCFKLPLNLVPTALLPAVQPTLGTPEAGALLFSKELRDLFEAAGRSDTQMFEDLLMAVLIGASTPEEAAVLSRLSTLTSSNAGGLCGQIAPHIIERRHDLEIENVFQIDEYTRLMLGANLRVDQGESEAYINGEVENASARLFGNLEIHLADPLFFNLGGYWERDELNGAYFSPRVALIYQFLPNHSLRAVYAESLRTMDIYEKRADIHLQPANLAGAYGSDPLALLGWEDPEFFATQESDGSLIPERIVSRELGYFARVGTFEWDIRLFDERLTELVSGPINATRFAPDNGGRVRIRGAEAQISWRPHPRHLLRATGATVDTEAYHPDGNRLSRLEEALAAEKLFGALWRYDINDRWMLASNWYTADGWTQGRYERVDVHVSRRVRARRATFDISGVVQYLLTENPVVRNNNLYREDSLYWLSASVSF
jgi:iron complex outermembrane recepter protein